MRRALIGLALITAACGERGSGDFASETRTVASFSAVNNSSEVSVHISVESSTAAESITLTVAGDDNLLYAVRTRVSGDTLFVETEHDLWPSLDLRLTATVPALREVESTGSGDIDVNGITGGDLAVVQSGSGDVTASATLGSVRVESSGSGNTNLSGTAGRIEVQASGSGDVRARGLSADHGDVSASGSGDVEVCVTGTLEAQSSGSGDIHYYCDPDQVQPRTSGSGDIIRH